ncbi:hypothetical protein [Candidatus Chromulinivorax destructor]|nr:hypothetical protein [Candidatus Chromulinivorax destructor]
MMWQQISDEGSSNKINARIILGLSEILNLISNDKLNQNEKDEVKQWLFELTNDLITSEKSALKVIKEHDNAEQQASELIKKGTLPSFLLNNGVYNFLNYSNNVFKKLQKVMAIIFKQNINGDNMGIIIKIIKNQLAHDHHVIKTLETYKPWYETVNNLRNEIEHLKISDALIINYTLDENANLIRPRFRNYGDKQKYQGFEVYEFVVESLKYQLLFCEELIVHSLLDNTSDEFELLEIPENERDIKKPARFKITLRGMN